MVEQAQLQPRRLADIDVLERLTSLQQAQEMKRAVQNADVVVADDRGRRVASTITLRMR
jgi:hypothetical protein